MEQHNSMSSIDSHDIVRISDPEMKTQEKKVTKYKETIFLTAVTGITAFAAFGATLAFARKKDPTFFNKGMVATKEMQESGAELALRALKYGTMLAFGGCGLISFAVWKFSGATNMKDFRIKMGEILPRISSDKPPQGRTEFESFRDLFDYLSTEYSSGSSKK